MRRPPQVHIFEYLVPIWWHCLGKIKRYGLCWRRYVKGIVFDDSKDSCHSQSLSLFHTQILLQYHSCLSNHALCHDGVKL